MIGYSLFSVIFLLLVSMLAACICIDVIIKRRFLLKYAKNIPVLPYLPITGSAHLFLGQKALATYLSWWEKMKTPFFFWIFHVPHYFTDEPSEIKEVLTNTNGLGKGYLYEFGKSIILEALLIAEVSIWKKKRRFLSKRFSQKTIESFMPVFNKMIDKLVATIDQKCSGKILEKLERFGVDTFAETICNIKIDELTLDTTSYREFDMYNCSKKIVKIVVKRCTSPWLYPDIIFFNTEEGREFQELHQSLDALLRDVVDERRRILEDSVDEGADKSMIDIMIEENMKTDDIVGEIKLFGAAAADTSGLTMALALNLLAIHQDLQEKTLREILDVVGPDRQVEYGDIPNLKYLEMVIKETLRLFPPAAMILRTVSDDMDIGRVLLPKGTNVAINIMSVHRSDKYWKDPLKFDPDRFLPDEVEKRPAGTFLPFSLGPRNCIGSKYSMILMKVTLATIIRKYKVTTSVRSLQDFKIEVDVTMEVEGIDCTFTKRNEN